MIDCVLELTTVVKTQIANQREVTKENEKREEAKVGDSYVLVIFLYENKYWTSCSESNISQSKPNYC